MMTRHYIAMFLLLVLCGGVHAQKLNISLEELFRLADENNETLKAANYGIGAASEDLLAAKSSRYPDISTSLSASYIANGLLCDRDFGDGSKIDMPHIGNNFSLQVTQVLYAGGAIKNSIALSDLGLQMAQLQNDQKRQEVRFLVAGYFLDIFKLDNQLRIFDHNIALVGKVLDDLRNRHGQGLALKNDITRYELQLETLKMQRSRLIDTKSIVNHQLTQAVGLEPKCEIVPDSSSIITPNMPTTTVDEWIAATEAAPTLRQMDIAISMSERKESLAKSDRRPRIALVGEEHFDGPILIEVPVINKNFNYWFAGIGIQYDISSLYKSTHGIRKARFETQRAQEERTAVAKGVSNGIHAVFVQYLQAIRNYEICEKALSLANENYQMTKNRYDNELAVLTDMLDASNSKLSAELELTNAKTNIFYYYLNLKYLTGKL